MPFQIGRNDVPGAERGKVVPVVGHLPLDVDGKRDEKQPHDPPHHPRSSRRPAHPLAPGDRTRGASRSRPRTGTRHDRVGIAAVRVMVQQHGRHPSVVGGQEVDHEHAGHGVAAELIERRETRFGRGRCRHSASLLALASRGKEGRRCWWGSVFPLCENGSPPPADRTAGTGDPISVPRGVAVPPRSIEPERAGRRTKFAGIGSVKQRVPSR